MTCASDLLNILAPRRDTDSGAKLPPPPLHSALATPMSWRNTLANVRPQRPASGITLTNEHEYAGRVAFVTLDVSGLGAQQAG